MVVMKTIKQGSTIPILENTVTMKMNFAVIVIISMRGMLLRMLNVGTNDIESLMRS